jgi:hypothetical protein
VKNVQIIIEVVFSIVWYEKECFGLFELWDIAFYVIVFLPFLVVWFFTYFDVKNHESPLEHISVVWYLLPIFFWVGGRIA